MNELKLNPTQKDYLLELIHTDRASRFRTTRGKLSTQHTPVCNWEYEDLKRKVENLTPTKPKA